MSSEQGSTQPWQYRVERHTNRMAALAILHSVSLPAELLVRK